MIRRHLTLMVYIHLSRTSRVNVKHNYNFLLLLPSTSFPMKLLCLGPHWGKMSNPHHTGPFESAHDKLRYWEELQNVQTEPFPSSLSPNSPSYLRGVQQLRRPRPHLLQRTRVGQLQQAQERVPAQPRRAGPVPFPVQTRTNPLSELLQGRRSLAFVPAAQAGQGLRGAAHVGFRLGQVASGAAVAGTGTGDWSWRLVAVGMAGETGRCGVTGHVSECKRCPRNTFFLPSPAPLRFGCAYLRLVAVSLDASLRRYVIPEPIRKRIGRKKTNSSKGVLAYPSWWLTTQSSSPQIINAGRVEFHPVALPPLSAPCHGSSLPEPTGG